MSISLKRKNKDEEELIEGITTNSRKRAKLEEIIFRAVSEKERSQANFSVNEHPLLCIAQIMRSVKMRETKIAKKCNKLLTSIHLKKKYKYYCKTHNVTYLVNNVRKGKKEISKQNRHNLVQNFRSLAVSTDSSVPPEYDGSTSDLDKNENSLTMNQVGDVKNDDVKDVFKKPETPIRKSQKRKASDSPSKINENRSEAINPFKRLAVRSATEETALNENQHSDHVGPSTPKILNSHKHKSLDSLLTPQLNLAILPKLLDGTFTMTEDDSDAFDYIPNKSSKGKSNRSNLKKRNLPRQILTDDEGDSDYERHELNQCKKYKVTETFVVTKNPVSGNIVFEKGLDYFETDDDANDSDCDCSVYDSVISESTSIDFSDSSSEDESDIVIFTG